MVSYADLVDLALASYDVLRPAFRRQYASLILAHDDEQHAIARERAMRVSAALGGRQLSTRLERFARFWPAENYHQKYHLRSDRTLVDDFRAMFGDDEVALRESTAAARVNGCAAGYGTKPQLAREMEFLGLSDAGRAQLISRVRNGGPVGACGI